MSVSELMRTNRESDLLRFSTAGSVDDGKSTLIGRLLYEAQGLYDDQVATLREDSKKAKRDDLEFGLLTDGLQAEREQGITIDVAYRHFSTPRRRFIIADTPGHEQYTRNMVTGASTSGLAIVLVDARNGVLTQTRRHAFISSLLAIPHMVVAVNKMDLVDYSEEVFENIRAEFGEFAARLAIKDVVYIPISALRGDNVVSKSERMPWYRGTPLLHYLEEVYVGADRNLVDLRFPIQYVVRPDQDYRGYAGEVASGVVRQGDEVMVLPSGKRTRVKAIDTFKGEIDHAFPPMSVTLLLEDEIDISRGDMLVHPGNVPSKLRSAETIIVWLAEKPMRMGRQYLFKHTTNAVRGHISDVTFRIDPDTLGRRDATELSLNEIGRCTSHFYQPLFGDDHERNRRTGNFIIIDPLTNGTVGAGMFIDRGQGELPQYLETNREKPRSENISRFAGRVTSDRRRDILKHGAATIWLTGLSGSGKSTIGFALEERLVKDGRLAYVLDGDNVRHGLNSDLGFSPEHREENIRRIAEVSRLMNDAGTIVVCCFISPYRRDRDAARQVVGEGSFVEVHVDTPLEVCEARDPRGLYRKARSGEIPNFTGISAPYEPPEQPEVSVPTERLSVDESVDRIVTYLEDAGLFD